MTKFGVLYVIESASGHKITTSNARLYGCFSLFSSLDVFGSFQRAVLFFRYVCGSVFFFSSFFMSTRSLSQCLLFVIRRLFARIICLLAT